MPIHREGLNGTRQGYKEEGSETSGAVFIGPYTMPVAIQVPMHGKEGLNARKSRCDKPLQGE